MKERQRNKSTKPKVDTWLPLYGVIAAIILIAVVVHIIKKKRKWYVT